MLSIPLLLILSTFHWPLPRQATDIHVAALEGDLEQVKDLLRSDPKRINQPSNHTRKDTPDSHHTPLHDAAWGGHRAMVAWLLDHGADVGARTEHGWTALHLAIRGSATAKDAAVMVDLLLGHKAEIDARDSLGQTPLRYAVEKGFRRAKVVRQLLGHGASAASADNWGWTPLHVAAGRGDMDIVLQLLEKGATAGALARSGLTPLHEAVWNGHPKLAASLRNQGAKVDTLLACYLGDADEAERFWKREPALVNAADAEGRSLLHWAVAGNRKAVVELLLAHRADPNMRTRRDSFTPLHWAVAYGRRDLVVLLLKHDASPDAGDWMSWTPLHVAIDPSHRYSWRLRPSSDWRDSETSSARESGGGSPRWAGDREILELLLKHDAMIDARTNEWGGAGLSYWPQGPNYTALHLAARGGWTDVAKRLLKPWVEVDARDQLQRTPLFHAIEGGHKEMVQLLLDHRAVVNILDQGGETPLGLAIRRGRKEIADVLRKHGAKATLPHNPSPSDP
jgi:ankyrin repeat protein